MLGQKGDAGLGLLHFAAQPQHLRLNPRGMLLQACQLHISYTASASKHGSMGNTLWTTCSCKEHTQKHRRHLASTAVVCCFSPANCTWHMQPQLCQLHESHMPPQRPQTAWAAQSQPHAALRTIHSTSASTAMVCCFSPANWNNPMQPQRSDIAAHAACSSKAVMSCLSNIERNCLELMTWSLSFAVCTNQMQPQRPHTAWAAHCEPHAAVRTIESALHCLNADT